jgi:hypothetical protein
MSRQEDTWAWRDAAVCAAFEKYFDQVQPPKEMSTLRCGYFAFSCLSWLRLPASGWLYTSAWPFTVWSAVNRRW